MRINRKNYKIETGFNTSIVLISDIHYYNKKCIKHLNKIVDEIKIIKPEYICISGDFIDKSDIYDEKYFIEFLYKLSSIAYVLISLGNHEFYSNERQKFKCNYNLINKMKKIKNTYVLDNENIVINNINFIGLTIPMECYRSKNDSLLVKSLNNLNANKKYYNVLLCHSPEVICSRKILKNRNFDLILSGHMHGGVTPSILRPIFKNGGIISSTKKLFPKVAYGYIKIDNTNIIITSGITVLSHASGLSLFKNLFHSEIVNIMTN